MKGLQEVLRHALVDAIESTIIKDIRPPVD